MVSNDVYHSFSIKRKCICVSFHFCFVFLIEDLVFYRLKLLFSSSAAFAKFEITLSLSAHYPSVPLPFSIQNHLGNIGWVKSKQERAPNYFFTFVLSFERFLKVVRKWIDHSESQKSPLSLISFWRICSFKVSDLHCYLQWILETIGLFFYICSILWSLLRKTGIKKKKILLKFSPDHIWTTFMALKTE